tara:strand:+ start:1379 stop:1543 length:165 start_codon:yes stop_codon:yes gene_type:complete
MHRHYGLSHAYIPPPRREPLWLRITGMIAGVIIAGAACLSLWAALVIVSAWVVP